MEEQSISDFDLYNEAYSKIGIDTELALSMMQKRFAKGDAPVELHVLEGNIYEHLKRYEEAARSYKNALQIDPKNSPAIYRLSRVERHLGDEHIYLQGMQQVAAGEPGIFRSMAAGVLALDAKEYATARDHFKDALDHQPDPEPLYYYGTALFWTKEYDKSVEVLQRIPVVSQHTYSQHTLGCSLQKLGDIRGARKAFEEATRLSNDNYYAHAALGALDLKAFRLPGFWHHNKEMWRIRQQYKLEGSLIYGQ